MYSGDGVGNVTDGVTKLPRFAKERVGGSEIRPRALRLDGSLSIDAISILDSMQRTLLDQDLKSDNAADYRRLVQGAIRKESNNQSCVAHTSFPKAFQ